MSTYRKEVAGAPGQARWEAAGLSWLAEAGAVSVAGVEEVDEHSIETTFVRTSQATPETAERFGRDLAALHAAGGDSFGSGPPGWTGDGWIGEQVLPLGSYDAFGPFYAELRVLPYAQKAYRRGALDRMELRLIERLAGRIADGEFDDGTPPQRIHGDLWSGNLLFSADGAVLIDPAAHTSHGLQDIGMLAIFGCPYLETISSAYAEAAGLAAGWRDLLGIHQLHHLLQHASAFGRNYAVQAVRVARRYD